MDPISIESKGKYNKIIEGEQERATQNNPGPGDVWNTGDFAKTLHKMPLEGGESEINRLPDSPLCLEQSLGSRKALSSSWESTEVWRPFIFLSIFSVDGF